MFVYLSKRTGLLHELGQVTKEEVFIDGMKIEANANRYTFVWKKSVTKHQSLKGSGFPAIGDRTNMVLFALAAIAALAGALFDFFDQQKQFKTF